MRSSTKADRAIIVLEIMREEEGVTKPLGTWLTVFNERLSSKHSLRSTKELAHVFKFMSCVIRVKSDKCFRIEKQKKLRSDGKSKISNLFYTLRCNEKCPYLNDETCKTIRGQKK